MAGEVGAETEEHWDGDVPQIFQVDEGLTPLQAVMEWAAEGNPPGQRVAYILSIPAAAAESSLGEARNVLLPLLSQLAFDDHPDVKQATAEVLGPLGPILAGKDPELDEAGGSADAMDLLVLAHRLLQDAERGVQEAAATSVAMFATLLTREHRNEHLSAVIDALMHNCDDEQMQECAVDLLVKVVASAGPTHPAWCEACALPRMLRLAMHRDYSIRVNAVAGLVQLAAYVPTEEATGALLSAFADLCADQVWSVRQDCASELAALAAHLPRQAVRNRLLPLWQALARDVSAWVQAAARRQAGALLASIDPEDCTEELVEAFVTGAAGPATLTEACAHFLPAVLHNLGMARWPQLRDTVVALAASEYVGVRVALAESMHQLAVLVGPAAVAADLLPVIKALSSDSQQAVGDALAVNICSLLAALPPPARLPQLAFLARMHPKSGGACGQWRTRLLIAEQLAGIAALLGQQGLAEVLLPATLRLCEDPVAAVREAAAAQLGCMVSGMLAQAEVHLQEQEVTEEEEDGEEELGAQGGQAAGALPVPQEQQQAAAAQPDEEADKAAAAAADREQQQEQQQQQHGDAGAAVAPAGQVQPEEGEAAAAAAPAALLPPLGQQPERKQQQRQEQEQAQAQAVQWGAPAKPAAVVQQIVQHMVELQRSGRHRARQTYLAFCTALLLPQVPAPAAQPNGEQGGTDTGVDAAQGASRARAAAAPNAATTFENAQQEAPAPAAGPARPQLPQAVAGSDTVLGLLEGALALASDAVPNVRLGVARLLATLTVQQAGLAAGSPNVGAALARLATDTDRDVQQAAAAAVMVPVEG